MKGKAYLTVCAYDPILGSRGEEVGESTVDDGKVCLHPARCRMNCSQSWLESVQSCASRAVGPCLGRQRQVHPATGGARHGHFVDLGPRRRVRVVHVKALDLATAKRLSGLDAASDAATSAPYAGRRSRTLSVASDSSNLSTEEYWFTRWSRPLRSSDGCNCSFRRSWRRSVRDSKISHQVLPEHREHNENYAVEEVSKRPFLEDYAESLLQTTLTEVFVYLSTDKSILFKRFGELESIKETLCDSPETPDRSDGKECFSFTNHSFVGSCDVINVISLDTKSECGLIALNPNDITDKTVTCVFQPAPTSVTGLNDKQTGENECGTVEHNLSTEALSDIDKDVSEAKEIVSSNNQSFCYSNSNGYKSSGKILEADQSDSRVPPIERRSRRMCNHTRSTRLPVLFFLHGAGSCADLWTGLVLHFARAGYEVVAPDMLGHGYSSAPDCAPAYAFPRLLQDALDVFDAFVGDRRSVVIGHAFGCSLAAAVARHRSQGVAQLVLISGGGPTPLAPRSPGSRPPALPALLRACLRPLVMCGFRRNILYAPCGKHIEPCELTSGGVPGYVLRHVAQGQSWPEGDAAFHRRILAPTLLVHGLLDRSVALVQACEMERTIPRAFLELIPNAGHLPMLDAPSRLGHMIHCFIDWWSD
ncbi:uncharacterized protein LOC134540086 isoform X2 [Bacillus rossius redtenbacheri]|uniref:uncharacterized protein LOC134540086 isoform X2 n=1 Tax=Bacillus rossius redtenbacheri TaxID=93214 RepID=UPI002FDE29B6